MTRVWRATVFAVACAITRPVAAQDNVAYAVATRGPQFLLSAVPSPLPLDVYKTPVLSRRLSLNLTNVTVRQAIDAISREAGLHLAYRDDLPRLDRHAELRADRITVAAALTDVLFDAEIDVLFTRDGRATLVRRSTPKKPPVGTVTGRVTDAESGTAIAAAQVLVVGTRFGASADDSGRYVIANVPSGPHRVAARRIGFFARTESVNVPEDGAVTLDFALTRAATLLGEVVMTATGEQRRVQIANAITTIRADSVAETAPLTTFVDLLQGRAAGVQVFYNGGATGMSSPIRIRGTNGTGLVSNAPILFLDGVRVEASAAHRRNGTFGFESGRLADINVDEIESIDVVKGPSAATLYGTDAANGVILIKTKRGKAGRPRWNFWAESGTLEPADKFLPFYYGYGTNLATGAVMQCRVVQITSNICRPDSVVTWNPLHDKGTSPFGGGGRQVFGAQASGGVQEFTYFLSGETMGENGYLRMPDGEVQRLKEERGAAVPGNQLRPNALHMTSLRANIGSSIGSNATANLSAGLISNQTRIPSYRVFDSGAYEATAPTVNGGWGTVRPGEAFATSHQENIMRFTTSFTANYQPLPWFKARATTGIDLSTLLTQGLQRRGEGPVATRDGRRIDERRTLDVRTLDLGATATWDARPDIRSTTTVGTQYNRRQDLITAVSATGLPPGSQTVAGAATITGSESTDETVVGGGFIEQIVSWRERVFLTGAVRFDGASSFGREFETASYPKAGISWLASEGGIGGRFTAITSLRLRAAYGSSGVQPSSVAALQRDALIQSVVNGASTTGARLSALGNTDLRPETQTEFETGVDAEFGHGRAKLEATYYLRRSKDAIVSFPLSYSVGGYVSGGNGFSRLVNLGSVENRGIEGLISVRAVDSRPTTLDLTLNGNLNRNKLIKLGEGIPFTPTSANQPGYPLNSIFQRPVTSYADANGDGMLTVSEVQLGDNPVFVGPQHPQNSITGIATLGFRNGALRITSMFDYRGDVALQNFAEANKCISGGTCRAANDPHTPLREQLGWVAYQKVSGTYAGTWLVDGRFIRLRELSAAFTLPSRLLLPIGARAGSVVLSGRNIALFYANGYVGTTSLEGQSAPGLDDTGQLNPKPPPARYWLLRLNLNY